MNVSNCTGFRHDLPFFTFYDSDVAEESVHRLGIDSVATDIIYE